jgi:hypothetical protein
MGWYLHEEFRSLIKLPTKYARAICATCSNASGTKTIITQEEFERHHKRHVLKSVALDGSWYDWKPLIYCQKCNEWTELIRRGSDGERCSCSDNKILVKNKRAPKYLSVDNSGLKNVQVFCHICCDFVPPTKEQRAAIAFGAPECMAAEECTNDDLVHIFHYVKHHHSERDRINIAYERGTLVSLIRAEYGDKLMKI